MTAREKRRNPGRVGATVTNRVYLMGEGIAHCVRCGRPMRCTNSECGRQLPSDGRIGGCDIASSRLCHVTNEY